MSDYFFTENSPIDMLSQDVEPPLMPLSTFFNLYSVSKALFYKIPPDQSPKVVRVGSKPMICEVDAKSWVESLGADK